MSTDKQKSRPLALRCGARVRGRGLLPRVLRAYAEGRPLALRPGDVMMLRHYFAEMELTRQDTFEILASYGRQKLESQQDKAPNDSYQPTPGNGAAKQGEHPNEK